MVLVELLPNRLVGTNHPCFIIAEIGQNHQGDINVAKQLIVAAKEAGADCVKFQKSSLEDKFTTAALAKPYDSPHAWGATYGEHKRFLEFNEEQFKELQTYAHQLAIGFTASAMDEIALESLVRMEVPFLKIGSGDANNFPLLEKAAKTQLPIVLSTGMQDEETVKEAYRIITSINPKLCILHCVSSYPTPFNQIHLNVIKSYQNLFPNCPIGYSGHETGSAISVAAVALGSKIIERHLTLDKSWKGNDHSCSLLPSELKELVTQVRQVELALGSPRKAIQDSELPCHSKLGKSCVAAQDLPMGRVLTLSDICIKVSQPHGWPPHRIAHLVGRSLSRDLNKDDPITLEVLETLPQ